MLPPDATFPRGPVAALVLAGGAATRMGAPKALLPLGGRPMIARVVEALRAAGGLEPILVVTGYQSELITAAPSGQPVRFVHNPDHAAGEMLSSLRVGLGALAAHVAAVLLVLADQPGVQPATLRALLAHWQAATVPLLVPTYQGRRGHPILLSASLFGQIHALTPPQTLRDVVHRHLTPEAQLAVPDPAILWDIDTPEDYRRAASQWAALDKR